MSLPWTTIHAHQSKPRETHPWPLFLTQRTPFLLLFWQFQSCMSQREGSFLNQILPVWGCVSKVTSYCHWSWPAGTHQCTGTRCRCNQAGRRSWSCCLQGECTEPGQQEHRYGCHPHRGWEVGQSLKREEGNDVQEFRPANEWALLFTAQSSTPTASGLIRNAGPQAPSWSQGIWILTRSLDGMYAY